jgi:hypothetical protein
MIENGIPKVISLRASVLMCGLKKNLCFPALVPLQMAGIEKMLKYYNVSKNVFMGQGNFSNTGKVY